MDAEHAREGDGGRGGQEPELLALLPRLTQISGALTRGRVVERAMEAAGIAPDRPAMSVLIALRMADSPLRVGEIATRLQVVGPHVTRLVHDLEKRGLARRVPDPDDRRARLIELTPEGGSAAERYLRTVLGWFTEALADWSERDRRELGRLLGRFADDVAGRLAALESDERPGGPSAGGDQRPS